MPFKHCKDAGEIISQVHSEHSDNVSSNSSKIFLWDLFIAKYDTIHENSSYGKKEPLSDMIMFKA
jgi:hypothetical protein